jgi:predicted permease
VRSGRAADRTAPAAARVTACRRVLAIVLTIILATAAGVAFERRENAIAHVARARVLWLMLWLLVPFVAYVNIARAHLSLDATLSIAIAAAAILLAGAIMWRLARGPLALRDASAGAAVVCTIQANTAYFGLPLVATLFSRAQLAQAVAYDGLVSVPMLVLVSFSVGARLGSVGRAGVRAQLRAGLLRNPVLLAVLLALLVPAAWAPAALVTPSHLAVLALLPLGFFVVGVTLGDQAQDGMLQIPPPLTPPIAAVVLLRMAFVPFVLLVAGLLLIDVPAPFYLMAAMPVGVNTVLVGHATGLDLRLTSSSIAWATTVALAGVALLTLVRSLG